MGTEYYLVNNENRTFYELGKGHWFAFNENLDALTDLEYLKEFIFEYCLFNLDIPIPDGKQYCEEIAIEIFEFAKCKNIKNIVLTNDSGDELYVIRCLGYSCVGTRYRSDTDKFFNQKCIDFENRHLNAENIKRYDYEMCSRGFSLLMQKFSVIIDNTKDLI